jgi:hypothetical protein
MPILTPNFKEWTNLMAMLFAPHSTVLKYDLKDHM